MFGFGYMHMIWYEEVTVKDKREPSTSSSCARGQELKSAFIPLLSIAMEKVDIDPVEFFKKNFVKSGDGYYWRDGN